MHLGPARSPLVRDCVFAAVLTAATQVELVLVADEVHGSLVLQHLCFAVMTAAVALRRRAPLAAGVAGAAGLAAQTAVGVAPVVGGFLALLVVTASMGYHLSARRALVGLAVMGLAGTVYPVVRGEVVVGDEIGNLALFVAVWGLARAARINVDRAVDAELSREHHAREAVGAERRRIARELHDSAAHAISLMTLQAGGARQLATEPAVVGALQTVEHAGRNALADIHRLLGLLRADGGAEPDPGPLADLPGLVDQARAAGLAVDLRVTGDLGALPPSLAGTVHRVVQESLTNAVRHAAGAGTAVCVDVDAERVEVEVVDDGAAHPRSTTGGYGLAGLRERVALFGGTLEVGRRPTGGWRVFARIPVGVAAHDTGLGRAS